eukprot:TRINITY_DN3274_c0_g1_i1.p1 TRINITY_DN3274_c0_g1~~TRINITY_DN3274_c0_g1_i1.p1  ORF type:complete len:190 (-),score=30.56 TRINITY_DN3274_c0_g1_i1:110-679(-)
MQGMMKKMKGGGMMKMMKRMGVFFFKQKTAYEIGLGIPAEPLFRSTASACRTIGSPIFVILRNPGDERKWGPEERQENNARFRTSEQILSFRHRPCVSSSSSCRRPSSSSSSPASARTGSADGSLPVPEPQDRKSGSAGMPRPISYAVFCLKKKTPIRFIIFIMPPPFIFFIIPCICSNWFSRRFTSCT